VLEYALYKAYRALFTFLTVKLGIIHGCKKIATLFCKFFEKYFMFLFQGIFIKFIS